MISAVAAFVLAFIVTSVLTPYVRRLALSTGVVDQPGGRHVHEQITPRLGGVAVIVGFFAPLAAFSLIRTEAMLGFLQQSSLVIGLVVGAALVGLVGAVDDVRGVGPWMKIAAESVAGLIAYSAGYRIDAINLPLVGEIEMGLLAIPVTVFWFLAITNAINLIDGLDGLAAGITLFATVCNAAIALFNGADVVVLLSAALGGSLLGFLRYNFNPATIFLGDSGSMFLGFTLAATSLAGGMTKSSTAVALLAPIIALGIPIVDTMLALVRRALARQSIFAADRGHIHHRLLDLGFTHRRVVLVLYLFSVLLAISALAIAFGRSWNVGLALAFAGLTLFTLVRMGFRVPARPSLQPLGVPSELTGRIEALVDSVLGAADEAELKRVLSRFAASEPDVTYLVLLDEGQSPSVDDSRVKRIYELNVGQRKRLLELCCVAPIEDRQDHLAHRLEAAADACCAALGRWTISDELPLSAARLSSPGA